MKNINTSKTRSLIIALTLTLAATVSQALPVLQVDIDGGTYIGSNANEALNESTQIGADTFTVDAIYTAKNNAPDIDELFYLVVGVTDLSGNAVSSISSGSININGTDYFDADFSVSNVPITGSPYGPYPTLNIPIYFNFDSATAITTYNVEDDPGDPVANASGGSLLVTFDVDRSALGSNYFIVFDLVAYDGTFAPYSHNGVSTPGDPDEPDNPSDPVIPEPASLALVALGLGGLASRRLRSKQTK